MAHRGTPALASKYTDNIEVNDLRKIMCLRQSDVSLDRFQFEMSLKTWGSMAYTVCHADIPKML